MKARWLCGVCIAVVAGCGGDGESSGGGSTINTVTVEDDDDPDRDRISNKDEGGATANADGDQYPNYLDNDSDGDGISDGEEAGDADIETEPVDNDDDGIPDFLDTDSDGDGISDTTELDANYATVDTDNDGILDHIDKDSDGDGIYDSYEGSADTDGDGIPNFRDLDSDDDGIPDAIEWGGSELGGRPLDSDDDGIFDALDLDSDNDFIPDSAEDPNGNGVVDAGESSPTSSDTDGDGTPDIVEVTAGSDPADPSVTISAGDFYFILPYEGPGDQGDLDFTTVVQKADVFISMDTTGSFGEEIDAVQTALEQTIVPGIAAVIPDAAFGVGRFEDLPFGDFGLADDLPFELLQAITTTIPDVVTGLTALSPTGGGLDIPESGYEALYQWATGVGLPDFGWGPFAPPGIGGVGFRANSLPIIVHITDAISHTAADYSDVGITTHSKADALAALGAISARVIGVDSLQHTDSNNPRSQLEELAIATRAVIPVNSDGKCLTGVNGTEVPPIDGTCPLVFDVDSDGSGLGQTIVDAVAQLATLGELDISTRTLGFTTGLQNEVVTPGFTTADFIKGVTAVPPPPTGSTIDGEVFRNVVPGSTVEFSFDALNDFQPSTEVDQLFDADIEILGDMVTVLDVRNVFIIVPRAEQTYNIN